MNLNETFPVAWVGIIAVGLAGGIAWLSYTHDRRQQKETAACKALVAETSMDSDAFKAAMAQLDTADQIGAIAHCSTVLGLEGAAK